ncbi:STAS domain-containing protein [Streptomyces sp. NPDC088725]|uniref:STAS domain-containing protein n=1 Tax=Streptomyces sp. NPDC088725 TaxID=3365873 RepID=UPI00382F6EA4
MTELTVNTLTTSAGPVLELSGELDHHSAPHVRDVLQSLPVRSGEQLIIDLGGLTFCDSSGITVLIAARNRALKAEAGIALAAVPDRVVRVFRIVGLEQVFPAHPTVQDAADAWRGAAG